MCVQPCVQVAAYLPVVLKLCNDFLPSAVASEPSQAEWHRTMLGAAGALAALKVLLQEHVQLLQVALRVLATHASSGMTHGAGKECDGTRNDIMCDIAAGRLSSLRR